MNISGSDVLQILNPMTENYEFVRNSVAPNLLETESVSGHAVYPHLVFEVGKIVRLDPSDNQGSVTRNSLGFLSAGADEGFNQTNSRVASLFYYLDVEFTVRESIDPRFITGRAADLYVGGKVSAVSSAKFIRRSWRTGVSVSRSVWRRSTWTPCCEA